MLEWSGVWDAHHSFASGRPKETVCGIHTASFGFGRSSEMVCGMHTTLLVSGRSNKTVCGMHTASFMSGMPNEPVCGVHTVSLASETMLQEGGGTNALPPTHSFHFCLPPPPPSPLPSSSYSRFCPPCSLGLCDVAFDGGRFCRMTWHRWLLFAVGDVAFDGGMERLSLVVGDVLDVICPHPSMRGGSSSVVDTGTVESG